VVVTYRPSIRAGHRYAYTLSALDVSGQPVATTTFTTDVQ
jgi:hypothetical protein